MTYQQGSLGGLLTTLYTDLGDMISCTLSPNRNIHGGELYLSSMNNVCFEVKKFDGNAISSNLEAQISKNFPLSTLLIQQALKKLNIWGKTAVEKSAWIKACFFFTSSTNFFLYTYDTQFTEENKICNHQVLQNLCTWKNFQK